MAEELLAPHQQRLNEIYTLSGATPDVFGTYYQYPIERYARFVQQLPASQAHHHAEAGGLLAHTLEVIVEALKIRRGRLLPAGQTSQTVALKKDVWTFGVFSAALCHDLGKPLVDLGVTVYDHNGDELGQWNPWQSYMDECGTSGVVQFRRNRHYAVHQRASLLLVLRIVGTAGLFWLCGELDVFQQWLGTVGGDRDSDGEIGAIVQEADGRSTGRDLGADLDKKVRRPAVVPLHEKLLTGLRYLLDEGKLPLNKDGAAGWVTERDVWLVSKRAIDAVRTHLVETGHSGIPAKNYRLFDELQEHRVLIPNADDRAVWRAMVGTPDWSHELSLIRIPASRIWEKLQSRPDVFAGTVTPIDSGKTAAAPPVNDDLSDAACVDRSGVTDQCPQDGAVSVVPDTLTFLPTAETGDSYADSSATEDTSEPFDLEVSAATLEITEQSQRQAAPNQTVAGAADANLANEFFEWLRSGISQNAIKTNRPKARVHVVEEGVLLVTPAIFKDFAELLNNESDWATIQKRVLNKELHIIDGNGLNVTKYEVKGPSKKSKIIGILFPDVSMVFGSIDPPRPNPHLRRIAD